jgi:hypothetical protein
MSVEAMTRLAAANPVIDPPVVESPERLRRLIEDGAATLELGERRDRSSPIGMGSRSPSRALVAIPICLAASVAAIVLSSGSSGPGVNVAAAAYAATSPKPGIVEATFITRIEHGIQAGSTLRQQEWNDAGLGLRRERLTFVEVLGQKRETHLSESASAPGRRETWSGGRLERSTIVRRKVPRDLTIRMAFGGITLEGVEGIALYRTLYRNGLMRLVGRERRDGRSLWKLESRPASYDANGRRVAIHTRLVVLVDPKTFLPIVERQIDVALRGHPTLLESDLISYRRLAPSEGHGMLFDLAAQHPGARVLSGEVVPKFRPLHKQR